MVIFGYFNNREFVIKYSSFRNIFHKVVNINPKKIIGN
jgi:hypothetical protein